MDIGDEVHRRLDAVAVRARGEGAVAEVLVDVPDAASGAVGRYAEQARTAAGQSERRQPALGDELVALGDGGLQALDHDRSPWGARLEFQSVDLPFKLTQRGHALDGIGAVQQLAQGVAQLGPSRLAAPFERALDNAAYLQRLGHATDLARWSSARSRTRV